MTLLARHAAGVLCFREMAQKEARRILGACLRSIVRYIDIAVSSWAICVCDKPENVFVSYFRRISGRGLKCFGCALAERNCLGSHKV
jgi:hypothetical protein